MSSASDFIQDLLGHGNCVLVEMRELLPAPWSKFITERDILEFSICAITLLCYLIGRLISKSSHEKFSIKLFNYEQLCEQVQIAEIDNKKLCQKVAELHRNEQENKEKMANLDQANTTMSETLCDLEKKYGDADTELRELRDKLDKAQASEQDLRIETIELSKRCEHLNASLNKYRVSSESGSSHIEELKKALEIANGQSSSMSETLKKTTAELTICSAEQEVLKARLEQVQNENVVLKEEASKKTEDVNALRLTVANLCGGGGETVVDGGWEIENGLVEEHTNLDEMLNAAYLNVRISDLEREIKRFKDLRSKDTLEVEKTTLENTRLKSELENLRTMLGEKEHALAGSQKRAEILGEQVLDLERRLRTAEAQTQRLASEATIRDGQIEMLKEEASAYNSQALHLKQALHDTDLQHRQERIELEKCSMEYFSAKRTAEQELAKVLSERDMWKHKYEIETGGGRGSSMLSLNQSAPVDLEALIAVLPPLPAAGESEEDLSSVYSSGREYSARGVGQYQRRNRPDPRDSDY